MDKKKRAITLLVFLLGIFLGAIDSGIVSPSRTVIQNSFGISDSAGIWMITIYTLAYAVSMPIVGKLADRYGRKKVYMVSIIIFAAGSLLCGLTNFYGNFGLMLGARVIQAIGGGGIVPIATAFIGQSFPPEKRGSALGLVGGIYGIATILGPTIGSSIIDIAGAGNWGWIFFINVPLSLIILILGAGLEENVGDEKGKLDLMGSVVLSIVILSLMYAVTNLDFFHFRESIRSIDVWPYLVVFAVTLPIFVFVERKAEDPILNIRYFTDSQIAITLIIGFLTGCGLMSVIFIPQFAENVLKIPAGRGGYLVTLMSVFAGVSAPAAGKLIDKYSAKLVTIAGFSCTAVGTAFMALYVTGHPSFAAMLIGLVFIGFGMGFTMGTPLNYLMLALVKDSEASSGIATLSLVRSLGIAVSPNIMIGFIAEAGKQMPDKIRAALPAIKPPVIKGFESMSDKFDASKMNFAGSISGDALDKFKSADVTAIVDVTKNFVSNMLDKIIPNIKANIAGGMEKALAGIEKGRADLSKGLDGINNAIDGINRGIAGMKHAGKGMPGASEKLQAMQQQLDGLTSKKAEMTNALSNMAGQADSISTAKGQLGGILQSWKTDYINTIEAKRNALENIFQSTLNSGFRNMFIAAAIIAVVGLALALFLKNKKMHNTQPNQ